MMTAGTRAHFLTVFGICDETLAEWTEDWAVALPWSERLRADGRGLEQQYSYCRC